MPTPTDDMLAQVHRISSARLQAALDRLIETGALTGLSSDAVTAAADHAADVLAADLQRAGIGTSPIAQRIGPIHTVDELCDRLTAVGERPLTSEAVRKRVGERTLIAFQTDDRRWVFPDWQFDRLAGQLVPNRDILAVWAQLPTDGFMAATDLAAWMNTRQQSLPADTPADTARHYGADDPILTAAIRRLRQRAA